MKNAKVVSHSNVITNARFDYSETQLNILYFILAGLKDDTPNQQYILRITDFSRVTGRECRPKHMKESINEMQDKKFYFEEPDGSYQRYVFFDHIKYESKTGTFNVTLGNKITPFLFDLKGSFTQVELFYYLQLTSKYAKRLYTILCRWMGNKVDEEVRATQIFEIEELRRMWGLLNEDTGENAFPDWSSFNRFAIQRAIKQINESTNILVLKPRLFKKGQAFHRIQFFFKPQQARLTPPAVPAVPSPVLRTLELTPANEHPRPDVSDGRLLLWSEVEQLLSRNALYFDKAAWTYSMLCRIEHMTPELMTRIFSSWNNLSETYKLLHGRYVNEEAAPSAGEILRKLPLPENT